MPILPIRWLICAVLLVALPVQAARAQAEKEAKAAKKEAKPAVAAPAAVDAKPATTVPVAAETKPAAEVPEADKADYVKTTTGVVFTGKIIEETAEQVVVLTKTGSVPIPRAIVQEIRKYGVDTRLASERISAVTIPAGEEAAFVDQAKALAGEKKYAEAAAVCKALMESGPTKALSDAQRDTVGRVAAVSYFELKDWPAVVAVIKYSALVTREEVGRSRLLAMAEALENSTSPNIGDQKAESFDQAMTLAMKWKADRYFKEALDYAMSLREYHRQEIIDRALEGAIIRLNKAEPFVPGTTVTRQPEILRSMVTDMVATVEKATVRCAAERAEMIRVYTQRTASVEIALGWNVRIGDYIALRQASEDCLANVAAMDATRPLKAAYKDEEYKQLGEQLKKLVPAVDALKYYDVDAADVRGNPIRIKGKKISLIKFGS